MNKNISEKLSYITLLQAFGIICVLLGHSVHLFSSLGWYFHNAPTNTVCDIIHHVIYSFHMPLFIFLSGYLFYKRKKDNFKIIDYIKKRIKRLILPFFAVGFLYYIPIFYVVNPQNQNLIQIINDFITLNFCGPFWFLITLFLITIFIIAITETKLNKIPKIVILTGFLVLSLLNVSNIPFAIASIFKLAIYYYLGHLFVEYSNLFKNNIINNNKIILVFWIAWSVLEYFQFRNYDNNYLTTATAIISIFLLYICSIKICNNFRNIANLSFIKILSKNMLTIYLLQEPIFILILKKINWGIGYNAIFVAASLFVATLLICLSVIHLRNLIIKIIKEKNKTYENYYNG